MAQGFRVQYLNKSKPSFLSIKIIFPDVILTLRSRYCVDFVYEDISLESQNFNGQRGEESQRTLTVLLSTLKSYE